MARPDAAALLSLAESVADGTPVDWEAAEREAGPDDQAVIQQLRVLANLAVVHRSLPAAAGTSPPRRAATQPNTTPAVGAWAHLALLERLGRGSFGEVYRAWDRHLEREVALKVLHGMRASGGAASLSQETADDPHVAAILREARLLARVRHSNVIQVYGVAVHEGRVGLWMELIRGETLEQLLVRNGPLNAREAALVGIDLCRALAAIHGAGLIHRDIKTQNVMRETGGRIVLMDLGTGRPSGPRTVPDFAGTPLYLAPEIFAGSAASEQSDVYSLGVLLYHLVTGAFPVTGTSVAELDERHTADAHVRLRDARADLPTAFVTVVDRALSGPERRYPSAGALEAALVATLETDGAAIVQETAAAPERAPWWTRWRVAAAAAVVAGAVALGGLAWPSLRDRTSAEAAPPVRAIAVLPLANLSNDPNQEYLADGMTEELIATLGHLDGIKVISRTSVMRYKRAQTPLTEIAKTLGVDAVLEGSILALPGGEDGDRDSRIRINARLIHAGTDMHLWNRTFERSGGDVLALQTEIARAVSEGIDARLRRASALRSQPQDFQAFDLYLRGRYYWNMRTRDGLTRSVQYFREATNRDPGYALAYAGLADAYTLLGEYSYLRREDAIPLARAAALTALDLDSSLGEVHASLGFIHAMLFEWNAAEASLRRATELKPTYAMGHQIYALVQAQLGRLDEALAHIPTAVALDPLSVGVHSTEGAILMWAGRYDEAIDRFHAALRLEPDVVRNRMNLTSALALRGDLDEARAEGERALSLAPDNPEIVANLACVLASSGRRSEAAAIAADLAERYFRNEHTEPLAVAIVYAALGDNDRTFEWLYRGRERRDPWLGYLKVDTRFRPVRTDPRFRQLLDDVGFPP